MSCDFLVTEEQPEGAHLEHQLLQHLEASALSSIVTIPKLLYIGSPSERYPYPWSVLAWIDGRDAWTARHEIDNDSPQLAASLAEAVTAIGSVGDGVPVPRKGGGDLGTTLRPHIDVLIEQVDRSRSRAGELFDVGHVLQLAAEAYDLGDPTTTRFLHDDLLPGNLIIDQGRVTAVLDWGGACYGDPARDLAVAWSVLGPKGRQVFRKILGPDDTTWARGRALELCHAVDAVLRYLPRRHAVGEVMATTLDRILADSRAD